jgi:hypothetical protein
MALFDALKNIYGNGGVGDPLVGIGMGLLSQRGGRGIAQGMQNVAAMSDLNNQRQRQSALDKLAQERESRMAAWQDWQRQHALEQEKVAQTNADRSFGLQQQQFGLAEKRLNKVDPILADVPRHDGTVVKEWIVPQVGQTVGVPVKQRTPATDYLEKQNAEFEARDAQMKASGLDPSDPRNQQFRLTGKFPREDAQPLTPTDKKAILEADESVNTNQAAINALKHAKDVSKEAWGFPGAPTLSGPASLFFEGAAKTKELDNTVIEQALTQLKAIFGGNPTEGERAILLQLQGSSSLPDTVRQEIYNRAQKAAEARLAFNKQRADELRGGTYYKSGGGMAGAPKPEASFELKPVPSEVLSQAKMALAKDPANRDEIIKRLRDNGYDPSGL